MRFLKLLGIAIFVYILAQLNWGQMIRLLQNLRWPLFLSAILIACFLVLTKVSRWYLLVKQQGIIYSYPQAFLSYLCGLYLGFVTPGRLGDMIKAVHLKKEAAVPLASGLANVVLDRLMDLFFLLLMNTLALAYFFYALVSFWSLLLPLGVIVALAAVFLDKRLGEWLLTLVFHKLELAARHADTVQLSFSRFHEGMAKLLPRSWIAVLLTVLANIFLYGASYLIALALNIQIAFLPFVCVVALSAVSNFLPFAGLGTREAIFITIFYQLGLSKEQAVGYTTLSMAVFHLLIGTGGFLAWQLKRDKDIVA